MQEEQNIQIQFLYVMMYFILNQRENLLLNMSIYVWLNESLFMEM